VAATTGLGTADRAVGSRVGASVVALLWAVFFFGIIDSLVAGELLGVLAAGWGIAVAVALWVTGLWATSVGVNG
jgi:hypothetical protein